MEIFDCIKQRKSTKSFTNEMPSDDIIMQIAESAVYAPSGMNQQTWHFTIVTNKDWLDNMAKRVEVMLGRGNCHYGAPVLIIASADGSINTSEADCACAIENMYLASTGLGLGACWINQLGKDRCEPLRDILTDAGVPNGDMVYGAIAVGYAPKDYNRKCKTIKGGAISWYK